jgi:DNA-binding transcriptional regulator GbsR (MarR family)
MATIETLQEEFADFAGELAESFSFNRSIGQIYGLLYLSDKPLSLDEIALRLKMSKGNASVNLRALESWGAVRPVWVKGSRRDHYEANRNLKEVALRRVKEGVSKRLDFALSSLEKMTAGPALKNDGSQTKFFKDQMKSLQSAAQTARRALRLLDHL